VEGGAEEGRSRRKSSGPEGTLAWSASGMPLASSSSRSAKRTMRSWAAAGEGRAASDRRAARERKGRM
jgi:hypothetical protein